MLIAIFASLLVAAPAGAVVPIKVQPVYAGTNAFGARDIDAGPTQAIYVEVSVDDPTYRRTDTIQSYSITGANASEFPESSGGRQCAPGVGIGDSSPCYVYIKFDPSTTGPKSATLNVSTNGGASGSLGLSGTGTLTKLTLTPATIDFGGWNSANDGARGEMGAVLKNVGSQAISFSSIAISGNTDFFRATGDGADCREATVQQPTTLQNGQSCTLRANWDPSGEGPESARITVTSNAGTTTLDLVGSARAPDSTADPGFVDFGSQPIAAGATATKTIDLRNNGSANLSVTGPTALAGPDAGLFTIVSDGCPQGTFFGPGGTCPVTVAFDPNTTGPKQASVVFTTNGFRNQHPNVLLNGLGTKPDAKLTPGIIGLGPMRVDLGPAPRQAFSLQSTGDAPLFITNAGFTGPDASDFSVDTSLCTASSTGIAPGAKCNVLVGFDPTTAGDKQAVMALTTGAGRIEVPVTGTGLAAPIVDPPPGPDPQQLCDGKTSTIVGTEGKDVLKGTAGPDVISGLGGNDTIRGLGDNDLICGGDGADRIFGGAGKDKLLGEGGNDTLRGGPGKDRLRGGPGRNHLTP